MNLLNSLINEFKKGYCNYFKYIAKSILIEQEKTDQSCCYDCFDISFEEESNLKIYKD